eukprot:2034017-Amphidinium_carterae.1
MDNLMLDILLGDLLKRGNKYIKKCGYVGELMTESTAAIHDQCSLEGTSSSHPSRIVRTSGIGSKLSNFKKPPCSPKSPNN